MANGGEAAGEPSNGFNQLIHAPTRLAMVALLAPIEVATFKFVRDQLDMSDSALSKQIATLEEAGYVAVRKEFIGKRPNTQVSLTAAGRAAFDAHLAALRAMVGDRLNAV